METDMDPKVYLVGNAHIDPVWLWRKTEGMSEIMATFRSALDRMDEFSGFVFTSACASYYKWVEDVDPGMFDEIKRRVSEGRWAIAGGFWVQPDCNVPAGESFARHALYSQRYFTEKFGRAATTGYNVDSFGHNGMLPQLLVKSGMNAYVFSRPDSEENPRLPGDLFIWQSPDGSRVTAARLRTHYFSDDNIRSALMLRDGALENGLPAFCFYGIGNHGGGPSVAMLRELETFKKEYPDIIDASADRLFDDIRGAETERSLPVVTDDLQHHASGCYSANSVIKEANRRAECELAAAETFNLIEHRLAGAAQETDRLRDAWQTLLFNQFHDILAGCSIREAYEDALNAAGAARDRAAETARLAAQRISWRVRTTRVLDNAPAQKNGWLLWEKAGEGAPAVVFNPHSFAVETAVQVNAKLSGVTDADGKPVAFQNVRGPQTNGGDIYNAMFIAGIPAFGYSTYYIYRDERLGAPSPAGLRCGGRSLENEHIRVTFDKETGGISVFYDKGAGRELAAAPMARAVVVDDTQNDTWAHNVFTFDKELGAFGAPEITLTESGPLRGAVRVRTRYNNSELTQTFYLTAGGRELQARCKLKLDEKHVIVKLSFPVAAGDPTVIYSMPYGFIEKQCDGVEEPGQAWAALADRADGAGVALINDSKHSYCAKGGELRMIAARSAIYADHYGYDSRDDSVEYLDQGELRFNYALMPFSLRAPDGANLALDGADRAPADVNCLQIETAARGVVESPCGISAVVRAAALLNQPPHVVLETHHDGALPPRWSGISISAANVICQAAKIAEDGRGYILRLYETAGAETRARVRAGFLGLDAELAFKPQEIRTIRIAPGGAWREVMLTEYDYPDTATRLPH